MLQNLIKILSIQVFITIVINFLVWIPSLQDSARQLSLYLWGGFLLSALNFTLLYGVWALVYSQKKVAPLVIGVVSKYAILGLVLWILSPLAIKATAFFALGVIGNSLALVLFGVTGTKKP